jgi:hypothetical protein
MTKSLKEVFSDLVEQRQNDDPGFPDQSSRDFWKYHRYSNRNTSDVLTRSHIPNSLDAAGNVDVPYRAKNAVYDRKTNRAGNNPDGSDEDDYDQKSPEEVVRQNRQRGKAGMVKSALPILTTETSGEQRHQLDALRDVADKHHYNFSHTNHIAHGTSFFPQHHYVRKDKDGAKHHLSFSHHPVHGTTWESHSNTTTGFDGDELAAHVKEKHKR